MGPVQITVDLASLSKQQQVSLVVFILTFNEEAPGDLKPSAEVEQDLAAVFGAASIPAPPSTAISQYGPKLVIPGASAEILPEPIIEAQVDKNALPWDSRIHSRSKALNADGTWRMKRGITDTLIAQVTVELQRLMAIPSPAAVPAPPAPVQTDSNAQENFVALIQRASIAVSQGKITQAQLQKCCDAVGIPSIPMLGARLDLVPQVANLVDGIIAGQSQ